MRVSLKGISVKWLASLNSRNGNQYIKNPNKNISAVRLVILATMLEWLIPSHLGSTKLRAFPTANKKEGNTKSVGVNPCHFACNKGAKVTSLPGVFTIIIKQIVIPRNTSRARNRCVLSII